MTAKEPRRPGGEGVGGDPPAERPDERPDERLDRLARKIEEQHQLIARLSAMLERRPEGKARADVARLAPSSEGDPARRAKPVRRPRVAWGLPAPPPPLDPAPGLDCYGLLARNLRVVGVSLLGLGGPAIERAVAEVAARQKAGRSFKPVFLTDSPRFEPLLRRGYSFEYLPRPAPGEVGSGAERLRTLERIRRKWGIEAFIGQRGEAGRPTEATGREVLAPVRDERTPAARPRPPRVPKTAPTPTAASPPPAGAAKPFRRRSYRPAGRPDLAEGGPLVSYCIPVMNRGAELRATLGPNLKEHRELGGLVEFVVAFFDRDQTTQDWVARRFRREIASGRLRVIRSDALDLWHFGRAKNAFRPLLRGRIYSSLDADNFVTAAETQQLIDIHAVHGEHFVLHHFSGTWGDGTSGRVSLPASLYREIGYNERFLPRQFDEIDLILAVLRKGPQAALICFSVERNLITLSERTRTFVTQEGLTNPFVKTDPVPRRAPLNPKSPSYVQDNDLLRAMNDFNQAISFIANAGTVRSRDRYVEQAYAARHRVVDLMPGGELVRTIFEGGRDPSGIARPGPDDICLFACVKDDRTFLPKFVEHYRARGVTRFFIVDDHSDPPLGGTLEGDDVHVLVPRVGTFLTAKGLWLEALLKGFLERGQWALTVDADEFVDLPRGVPDFRSLAAQAEARGRDWVAGLLIDMLPASASGLLDLERNPEAFEKVLSHCCRMSQEPAPGYRAHPSIRWGFGHHARLSWTVDARFHAFGTFDSLRKIPFLRHRPGLHLNQGFHDLQYTDGTRQAGPDIWGGDPILPIRHYKLSKLLSAAAREQLIRRVRTTGALQYHPRSAANIQRILGENAAEVERLLRLPLQPYPDGFDEALRLDRGVVGDLP